MPDLSHLNMEILTAPTPSAAAPVLPLRVITAEELAATRFPPRKLLLAPWLPQKGLAMVYGARGIGKTHLTLNVAYAVATGGSFLRWQAPGAQRVLIIDGEMPAVTLQTRLAAITGAAAVQPQPGLIRFLAADLQERDLDLSDPAHQDQLAPLLEGVSLVIVDNISTLSRAGKENEAESWLPVQQWALGQRRAGRSVLFMHHAGKGGAQRGTSRREDVLDTVIALRQPQDYQSGEGARFEIHFEKNRGFFGDDAKPFEAALTGGRWTTRDVDDAEMERVVLLKAGGASVRDIAEETGLSKSKVDRVLKRAADTRYTTPVPAT